MPNRPQVRCPTCKQLHPGTGRCVTCERKRDKRRGTRQQRGYDANHDHLRAELQRLMDAGQTYQCWRCGETIDPSHWHLGHDDDDRSRYRGPECVETCNLAAAGRKTAALRKSARYVGGYP